MKHTSRTTSNPSPLAGEGGARRNCGGRVRGSKPQARAAGAPPHPAALRPPSPARGEGKLLKRARKMRREMTPAERKLWYALRDRRLTGIKFRRQVVIGNYIADFVCQQHKMIVEADGGQHNENTYDALRDRWLKSQGFTVLRFWNGDILDRLDGVLATILNELQRLTADTKS